MSDWRKSLLGLVLIPFLVVKVIAELLLEIGEESYRQLFWRDGW